MEVWADDGEYPEHVERGEFHGSNVDLGVEIEEIQVGLARLAHRMDEGFRLVREAEQALPRLRAHYRAEYARALETHMNRLAASRREATGTATLAKALAESEARQALREVETMEGQERVGRRLLKMLETRISALQTRANLWRDQRDLDLRGGPR